MALAAGRIAPTYGVGLEAPFHGMLDEAAAWREIHHVVLVDLRWHDHHGGLPHHLGPRCVLDELTYLVLEDHRPRRRREVSTEFERAPVHRAGTSIVLEEVPADVLPAFQHASSSRLEGTF